MIYTVHNLQILLRLVSWFGGLEGVSNVYTFLGQKGFTGLSAAVSLRRRVRMFGCEVLQCPISAKPAG